MSLFLDNGYLNIREILNSNSSFIFIVGARGVGKTYGALKYALESGAVFGYMRRTQAQADIINKEEFSPLKPVLEEKGLNIGIQKVTKYSAGFYAYDIDEKGKRVYEDTAVGYTLALSTVANLRGFDMSNMKLLIYDEFIPEKHERLMKGEGNALLNCYETINRNRELNGQKPLKLLCLANSNDLINPVFEAFGITEKAESMHRKKQIFSRLSERSIDIYLIYNSPVSVKKAETALYKAAQDSTFKEMALNNDFNMNVSDVGSVNIIEYAPYIQVEKFYVYKHKFHNLYYVTDKPMNQFSTVISRKQIFAYPTLKIAYINSLYIFENYVIKKEYLIMLNIDY